MTATRTSSCSWASTSVPSWGWAPRDSAIDLLDELDISYPTAYTLDARVVRDHNVLGMPTTIFYDGDGVEVGRHVRTADRAGLRGTRARAHRSRRR